MTDKFFDKLLDIQKELSSNTTATRGIEDHLRRLNGKVASHENKISKMTLALAIVGTCLATLAVSTNPELVKFIITLL